jgi:release factor glutamine methyltransferase
MQHIDKVRAVKEVLEQSGIEDAHREAELIVSYALGTGRAFLYQDSQPVPEHILMNIDDIVRRRAAREPLQYILGSVDFCGLKIKVGPGVLIPRPETEWLAEEAIKTISNTKIKNTKFKILDLCTGSGCLALALAKAFPSAVAYAIDSEETAVRYAEENAAINTIGNIIFLQGSLFDPLEKAASLSGGQPVFDLIVSNPPYIRRGDINTLQPEIRDWEPLEALDGGEDGLDFYRAIILKAGTYLTANGMLLFELGIHQAPAVKHIAEQAGFQNISVRKDYAGIERILIIQKE